MGIMAFRIDLFLHQNCVHSTVRVSGGWGEPANEMEPIIRLNNTIFWRAPTRPLHASLGADLLCDRDLTIFERVSIGNSTHTLPLW
jgi:hypothetical protein